MCPGAHAMESKKITDWLLERSIEEVEGLMPNMAGTAVGKFMPAKKFRSDGMCVPDSGPEARRVENRIAGSDVSPCHQPVGAKVSFAERLMQASRRLKENGVFKLCTKRGHNAYW